MEDNNAIVVQRDATTCAPLVGEPKSLISKGGKNALNCNQVPSLEFVSDKNRLDCFAFARNDAINENIKTLVPQCPSALMPTVTNLFPYSPISFSPKKKIAFTLAESATHVDLPPTKMKFAFTLAEVLITLGIIGIVAAMTIPTLLSNFAKQKLEEQIKVTYSSIQQTIKFMDDDGLAFSAFQDDNDAVMKEWFDMYLAQHMKTESVCINAPGCWHKYGVAKDLQGNLNPWDRSDNVGWGYNIITFTTAKGAWFDMDGHAAHMCRDLFGINTDDKCLVIYFDANGDRKPNRVGKDIHTVVWTEDGLVPAGSDKSTAEVKQNCTRGNGYWCLQEIINDSWKIPDSVWKR